MYLEENPLTRLFAETGGTTEATATWGLKAHPLAMVYAPLQAWEELYDPATALQHGTLFGKLDKPFLGREV